MTTDYRLHSRTAAANVRPKATKRHKPDLTSPPPVPVVMTKADPAASAVAQDAAHGRDVHLVIDQNGSVNIANDRFPNGAAQS